MSRHPDLYLFLCLLTGLATFLAITYECIQKFRRKPPVVLPLDGLQRDRPAPRTEERASKRPSDFSRLCESTKDLPPKEQASRVQEYRNPRRSAARGGPRSSAQSASGLHTGAEQAKKPLPTQVHTRRDSTARTALSYAPLEE
jgi:hypothetical protein